MKRSLLYTVWFSLMLAGVAEANVPGLSDAPNTLLIQAAADGDLDRVNAALNAGASVDAIDMTDYGATVLMWAAQNGHTEIVKLLCEWGSNANVKTSVDDVEYSALKLARYMENKHIG